MRKLIAIAAVLALPALPRAGGYAVPNISPRDLALAGSAVAAQRDAAAVYANPAALAGLAPGLHLSLGISAIDNRSTWSSPDRTSGTTMDFHPATPPAVYAAWSGKWGERGWGIGAGMTVPFGGNVRWPAGWPGRFEILDVNRRVYGIYLNGGVELLSWLRVGGGAIYYRTTEYLKQGVSFVSNEGWAELGAAGGAPSFQAAAEAKLADGLKFGIDYKHQAVQKLTGRAHFENPPAALASNAQDQDVTHILTVPNTLQAGLGWQVTPGGLLTAAVTWERFKVYRADLFVGSAGTRIDVPRDYMNGYTFRLGGEVAVSPDLVVRAGLLRDIGPTKVARTTPSIPDGDTWAASFGASYAITPRLAVQGSWFYAITGEVQAPASSLFPGAYNTTASILALGLVWSPGAAP